MAGNLSVPNDFATQSGNVPASEIDDDFGEVETYVNNREITSGTFAGRPAAGVSGRWYFANDLNGGTLYFDTGSTWVKASAPVNSATGYSVTGLTGVNNSGAATTQYDLAASQVTLWDPDDFGTVTRTSTGTVTNNISTAGPAANGRDQAGAFSSNSWVHFYFIWNGTTLASVSSATAPPTGPTLPSGYTHWAYLTSVRLNGSTQLNSMTTRGARQFWNSFSGLPNLVLNAGTAGTETAVGLTAAIPPGASSWTAFARLSGGASGATASINLYTGVTLQNVGASVNVTSDASITAPNVSQNVFYLVTGGTGSLTIVLTSFTIPNGDVA